MSTNNATNTSSPVSVSQGGTGASSLTGILTGNGSSAITANSITQYNTLVAGASNAISSISPGSSGQVLTSNGASSNPSYQSLGSSLQSVTINLTNSQIKNLFSTPITVVAAPGAGLSVMPVQAFSRFTYGGTNAFTTGTTNLILYWGTTANSASFTILTSAEVLATNSLYRSCIPTSVEVVSGLDNAALIVTNTTANYAGNAANNNTISFILYYLIVTTPT